MRRAVGPNVSQRDAVEQLRRALAQAIERIAAACPAAMPTTVAERLKAIQDRIWAMHDALLTIRRREFDLRRRGVIQSPRPRGLLAIATLAIRQAPIIERASNVSAAGGIGGCLYSFGLRTSFRTESCLAVR
jgi:hypothetical protein